MLKLEQSELLEDVNSHTRRKLLKKWTEKVMIQPEGSVDSRELINDGEVLVGYIGDFCKSYLRWSNRTRILVGYDVRKAKDDDITIFHKDSPYRKLRLLKKDGSTMITLGEQAIYFGRSGRPMLFYDRKTKSKLPYTENIGGLLLRDITQFVREMEMKQLLQKDTERELEKK